MKNKKDFFKSCLVFPKSVYGLGELHYKKLCFKTNCHLVMKKYIMSDVDGVNQKKSLHEYSNDPIYFLAFYKSIRSLNIGNQTI